MNKILPKKINKNNATLNQYKSPNKNEKITSKINIINRNNINIISPGKNINFLDNNNNNTNYIPELQEDKDNKLFKGFLQKLNKIGEFGFNEKNTYMFPITNKDLNDIPDNNNIIYQHSPKNENRNNNKDSKEIDINSNINKKNISPGKSNALFNNDLYDSKYSFKINKIKDDYIDFLQKEFEDNTKKSAIGFE